MSVDANSRYKGAYIYLDETTEEVGGTRFLSPYRENVFNASLEDIRIVFQSGMRIDSLAHEYYGDYALDWVIMDANPKYLTPFDIKVGDELVIPSPERVMNR